ncbi:uncharacterized protein Tco025E_00951 [Trypanosoma conorhini]|uniref:FHA domain-containing protein n=1 Tax=Trypanosoma conorhini TaxID=83891 RepID=A0A422QA14_9TRYP|nr:uncharacterized protein Tco025E_00951 [Trypanosoma conorhini]RNF26795.1 hypothetical protein Tco025E_00951 [Trypanosoma conorhini]
MHGGAAAPLWRLKVINGCQRNDDLLLPVVPQSSLLRPFYTHWRDEDEERQSARRPAEATSASGSRPDGATTRKSKKKKMKSSAARRCTIAPRDWLKRIPHLVLGRHTCLPRPCRLRHACVSRLHCRVVYVGDAATHRQLLSKYPAAARGDAAGATRASAEAKEGEASLFTGPYYRLINFGANPLYVNEKPLPAGESRALREHDFVAFLENPFDAEAGVLHPLQPAEAAATANDANATGPIDATDGQEPGATAPTARALFGSASTATAAGEASAPACGLEASEGACVPPLFVEVNGVRLARYRPRCVPPDVLQRLGAAAATLSGGAATPARRPQFAVEHNRLLAGLTSEPGGRRLPDAEAKVSVVAELKSPAQQFGCAAATAALAEKSAGCSTPPPKCPAADEAPAGRGGHNTVAEAAEDDEGADIVGDVVSPLRQRLVSSPRRGGSSRASRTPEAKGCRAAASGHAACGGEVDPTAAMPPPFTVVPPRLPVYVFARRSPSPEEFTRQAPSIGRFRPRLPRGNEEEEAKKRRAAADAAGTPSQTELAMTEWVQEHPAEATTPQHRRGRAKRSRKRRRGDR